MNYYTTASSFGDFKKYHLFGSVDRSRLFDFDFDLKLDEDEERFLSLDDLSRLLLSLTLLLIPSFVVVVVVSY
jgi:hypothetical protein